VINSGRRERLAVAIAPSDAFPTPPNPDEEARTATTWQRFLRSGELPSTKVRPVIEDSWVRCHRAGVDPNRARALNPLPSSELEILRLQHRYLLEASATTLAQSRDLLAQSRSVLVVTTPTGVVLELAGDARTVDAAADMRLMSGADWNESPCGTNAIGTALAARGPVQVHASEHFCDGMKAWTCSATVVRDPGDGRIIGGVDLSGPKDVFDQHLLALVVAASGRIQTALAARELERNQRLFEYALTRLPRIGADRFLLFDRLGRLVGTRSRAPLVPSSLGASVVRVEALDTTTITRGGDSKFPDWMVPERLEPIVDGDERLGTLVIVQQRRLEGGRSARGGLPRYKLKRVVEFIDANLERHVGLHELCSVADLSRFHFHRQFKQSTGQTPQQYLRRTRIERAKRLLQESDLPLADVAARTGFADQSHFTTVFRAATSLTPRAYRNATR
jgi:sigma-54 dependent transcriptional regulator, acetoin dehydrogenase operon transcriptional activator AcoR